MLYLNTTVGAVIELLTTETTEQHLSELVVILFNLVNN